MSDTVDSLMVQASFKTSDGTLINAKGHDEQSFALSLAIVHDHLASITEIEQKVKAVHAVAQSIPLAATQPPSQPPASDGWDSPSPAFASATAPACSHGQRVARAGVGAKGPWKAWFCAAPKDVQPKCDAVWVRKGSPEWDSHPA